jgi:hypothetical protein
LDKGFSRTSALPEMEKATTLAVALDRYPISDLERRTRAARPAAAVMVNGAVLKSCRAQQ